MNQARILELHSMFHPNYSITRTMEKKEHLDQSLDENRLGWY